MSEPNSPLPFTITIMLASSFTIMSPRGTTVLTLNFPTAPENATVSFAAGKDLTLKSTGFISTMQDLVSAVLTFPKNGSSYTTGKFIPISNFPDCIVYLPASFIANTNDASGNA